MTDHVLVCDKFAADGTCSVSRWIEYVPPVFNSLVELDSDVVIQINALLLLTFFVGHVLGRFLKRFRA